MPVSRTELCRRYEIKVVLGEGGCFDPERISNFRGVLMRHPGLRGLLPEIFRGTVTYSFRSQAVQVIATLPRHLQEQYERCRERTPILAVSTIKPDLREAI